MKLITYLELVQEMTTIYRLVVDSEYSFDEYFQLSTRLNCRIDITKDRAQLEVFVDTGYNTLINLYNWGELNSTLRNDYYLRVSTEFHNIMNNGIYRETDGILYKAANVFPVLAPKFAIDQLIDENEIEPLIFQLMTKYTENEVQSMIAVQYLCPDLTLQEKARIKYFPVTGLDFRALSFLSEEDVIELKNYVMGVQNVLSHTKV